MKRFYQLLFIVTALVGGNLFGMENKIDTDTLSQCCYGVMQKMRSSGLLVGSDFKTVQLDVLNMIIQKATDAPLHCTDDDINIIMTWVQVFDDTWYSDATGYEDLFRNTLGAIIKAKNAQGLTFQMQPWENIILQKGAKVWGLSKGYVDVLRQKEEKQEELLELQKQADDVALTIFAKLSLMVKSPRKDDNQDLDKLLQDKLVGADAPLSDYLDYINTKIRKFMQNPRVTNGNEVPLNNLWNIKFEELSNQRKPQNIGLPNSLQDNQPDAQGGQPGSDVPKGLAALCAAITAPKLAIMAVVVGVGYFGYKKYIAYKEDQASAAVETMADKEKQKEEEAENKHNVHNKQSVRKQ